MTPSRALDKAWQKVQKHWKMLSFGKGQGSFGLGKGQKALEKAKKHWKRPRSLGKGQGGFGKCSSLEKAKVAFLYNHVSPMTRGKDLDCSLKNACFAAPEILIFLLISYGQNHHFLHGNIDLKNQYLILIFQPIKINILILIHMRCSGLVISIINHSHYGYKPTWLSRGPHTVQWTCFFYKGVIPPKSVLIVFSWHYRLAC